jgi:hypothetical protein
MKWVVSMAISRRFGRRATRLEEDAGHLQRQAHAARRLLQGLHFINVCFFQLFQALDRRC